MVASGSKLPGTCVCHCFWVKVPATQGSSPDCRVRALGSKAQEQGSWGRLALVHGVSVSLGRVQCVHVCVYIEGSSRGSGCSFKKQKDDPGACGGVRPVDIGPDPGRPPEQRLDQVAQ